jgi:hypothetical protein
MQTEITQTIIQKVPMLSDGQQRKLLSITESFLNETATETGWSALKKAIADNQINSGVGDLANQHDHYIYGTEKK